MFLMVENTEKDHEHYDVLETPVAANTLSLVYIINSGPFGAGFF